MPVLRDATCEGLYLAEDLGPRTSGAAESGDLPSGDLSGDRGDVDPGDQRGDGAVVGTQRQDLTRLPVGANTDGLGDLAPTRLNVPKWGSRGVPDRAESAAPRL